MQSNKNFSLTFYNHSATLSTMKVKLYVYNVIFSNFQEGVVKQMLCHSTRIREEMLEIIVDLNDYKVEQVDSTMFRVSRRVYPKK